MNATGATTVTEGAAAHLVLSRLLSRGRMAAPAARGAPTFDTFVTSVEGDRRGNRVPTAPAARPAPQAEEQL